MSTKEKLAAALTEANAPDWMIKNAQNGMYDDFDSPLATPCIQLVADCRAAGLEPIAQKAINGEFDATKEESDAWFEREGKDILRSVANKTERRPHSKLD